MKDKDYTKITGELEKARRRHKLDFVTSTKGGTNDIERLRGRLDFDRRYAYNPELFEIHE